VGDSLVTLPVENSSPINAPKHHFGPASFVAALANILAMEIVTWIFLPWMTFLTFLFVLPVLAVELVPAAVLATRPGKLGQVGRGILIGWISAPVSMAVYSLGFAIARAIGLI
jgi:hypothetical protein